MPDEPNPEPAPAEVADTARDSAEEVKDEARRAAGS